jgi:hypothetical protein
VLTQHELKLWVLREVAATSQPVHKFNLIGRSGYQVRPADGDESLQRDDVAQADPSYLSKEIRER